ncbi:MAG TPA: SDR family oxidoreductase [Planctomycetota bacterium]|nr:SDR family oxidoreductase [Planctomycetota bacterium]
MLDLSGQCALVTGAGVRLGRALAEALAARGCKLILHCNTSRKGALEVARVICKNGGDAAVLGADLCDEKQVLNLARTAEKIFGGVDILINNAAVFWPTPLEKLNAAQLDAFHRVNLQAPFILSSELGRRMLARAKKNRSRRGAILNMACLSGLKAWKTHLPYSISKAGVISLTVGLAKLLAPHVRVNAIAPGTVLPPEKMSAAERARLRKKIPLQTFGSPQDIVDAALYLLSAPFVTGQVLVVDGGRSL